MSAAVMSAAALSADNAPTSQAPARRSRTASIRLKDLNLTLVSARLLRCTDGQTRLRDFLDRLPWPPGPGDG